MHESDAHVLWRATRQAELTAPESWLGLCGLFWLAPGENRVGSADDCPVRLPVGPLHLGSLKVDGRQVRWQAREAVMVEQGGAMLAGCQQLVTDREGKPSRVVAGALAFSIIERDGRLAVRLRDLDWASRRRPPPLAYFEYDPAWLIEAAWQKLPAPVEMSVPNVTGDLVTVQVAHRAVFDFAGQTVTLLPMSVSDTEIFFVFRDRTSGRETYGAGRFLKVPTTVNGKIRLNFNFAFNPPCAFTAFATCPLPPPENRLPFAVPAGEMKWLGEH